MVPKWLNFDLWQFILSNKKNCCTRVRIFVSIKICNRICRQYVLNRRRGNSRMKWMVLCSVGAVVIGVISLAFVNRSTNNVCKTFNDYYSDRDRNENCYYNPDHELTVPEVVKRWGYPVETHYATTEDGYILTLFRIPHGKNSVSKKPGAPIFLQHGYKSSSKCFTSTGTKSLSFILADQGYDVWLGNFRGTIYSKNHTKISLSDEKFWDFSFHEIGTYDIPAQINVVNGVTKQKVIYIGFSMGTTAATIYSSTYPEIALEKVKIFINMAPFIFTNGMSLYTRQGLLIWKYIAPIVQALTNGQYYTKTYGYVNEALWKFLCFPYPFQMKMCQVLDMLSFGFDYEQNDPETLPVTLLHLTETSSVKTVSHLSQLMLSGNFQQYDYGVKQNMLLYGSEEPPSYDLSKMQVPTYMIRSENDLTSTKEAIEKFNASLPEKVKPYDIYVVKHKKFNHIDFVWAKDVVPLLYDHLVKFLGSL